MSPEAERPEIERLGIPFRRQVLYAVVLTLCGLAALELACRLLVAAAPNPRWSHHVERVAAIGFGELNEILEPDRELMWRVKPGLAPRKLSGRIAGSDPISFTVSTDAEGYRRSPEVPDPESVVLFLGDSCTFGIGVDDEQTFPALLQQRLPGVRSRNAGVPGYSALQGRVLLETRSFAPPPDVVVVSFLFNDDTRWDDRSDLEIVRALASPASRLARSSRLVSVLSGLIQGPPRTVARDEKRLRLSDEEYADQLRGIAARCRPPDCETVFVVWPLRRQMADAAQIGKQAAMAAVAREVGVSLVDLVPVFRAQGGTRLFADVVHANADGNRLVADQLEPVLRRVLADRRRSEPSSAGDESGSVR